MKHLEYVSETLEKTLETTANICNIQIKSLATYM
jgi:hypothetical protein